MKYKQPHSGMTLGLSILFPMTITIMLNSPLCNSILFIMDTRQFLYVLSVVWMYSLAFINGIIDKKRKNNFFLHKMATKKQGLIIDISTRFVCLAVLGRQMKTFIWAILNSIRCSPTPSFTNKEKHLNLKSIRIWIFAPGKLFLLKWTD